MVLEPEENLSPEQQEIRFLQQCVQETMDQVSSLYERVILPHCLNWHNSPPPLQNKSLHKQVNELQTRHSTDTSNFRSTLEAKDDELDELRAKGTQLKQELDSLKYLFLSCCSLSKHKFQIDKASIASRTKTI